MPPSWAGCWSWPPGLRAQAPPSPGGDGTGASGGPTVKMCVMECQPTTKTVYGSVCKEYCLPHCSLLDLFRKCCGGCCGGCTGGDCGPVLTRHVLVKKVVPGP